MRCPSRRQIGKKTGGTLANLFRFGYNREEERKKSEKAGAAAATAAALRTRENMRKQTNPIGSLAAHIRRRSEESKSYLVVLSVYAAFCLASAVYFFAVGQIRNGSMSLAFILFAPLFFFVEKLLRVTFPTAFAAAALFVAAGGILGTCYDLYTFVPCFDTVLHGVSGFVFACFGFSVLQLFIGVPQDKKSFFACLLFGLSFSLAIALIWELFEYMSSCLFGADMEEDTIIRSFGSYLLAGGHAEIVKVEDIVKTVVYLRNGQTITIDGYLELGLIDTIGDMAICLVGGLVFLLAFTIDRFTGERLSRAFLPRLFSEEPPRSQE